jgi:hypothetical protein
MKKLSVLFILLSLFSCEKEGVICDTSFKSLNLYPKDTLEYVMVTDYGSGYILYSDSVVYDKFKVVDDSYFHFIGANNQTTLNIQYQYLNDSSNTIKVCSVCVYTDECHINFSPPSDTLWL